MALVILEGLDRTGKSTVAEIYKNKGFEVVHQSAPKKGLNPDLFLEEQMQLVSSAAGKDILLDRSYYGELVWPQIYGRESLLSDDGIEALREIEQSVGTTHILMHDPNIEAHWQRCVDNKEPLTKAQFLQARKLWHKLAEKYAFERKTLQDFEVCSESERPATPVAETAELPSDRGTDRSPVVELVRSPQQVKLDTANAINDVLSKRIVKSKGPIYDKLESNIRAYLNSELGKLFGGSNVQHNSPFDDEEVQLLKFFCNKLKAGK